MNVLRRTSHVVLKTVFNIGSTGYRNHCTVKTLIVVPVFITYIKEIQINFVPTISAITSYISENAYVIVQTGISFYV